jgi:hypothetical protein
MYGQDVGLSIVVKEGKALNAGELKAWLTERIAKFKLPKKVRRYPIKNEDVELSLTLPDLLHRYHVRSNS